MQEKRIRASDVSPSKAGPGLEGDATEGVDRIAIATMVGGAVAAGLLTCAWALLRSSNGDRSSGDEW